jgi:hypothetical protein
MDRLGLHKNCTTQQAEDARIKVRDKKMESNRDITKTDASSSRAPYYHD